MLSLFVIDGPDKGKGVSLDSNILIIGRSPKADFQVYDRSVSARHLRVVKQGNEFFVEDLHSTNGTYLNGVKLIPEKPEKLNEGDTILVGATLLSVERDFSLEGTLVQRDLSAKIIGEVGEEEILKGRPLTKIKNFEVIYRLATALMESFDIYAILETVMNSIFDCLKRIDRGAILLLDESRGEIKEIISRCRSPQDTTPLRYSKSIVQKVVQERKPISMVDTERVQKVELSDSIKAMKIRSVMCVPLISRRQVRGAIYVDSLEKPHSFRKEDLHLLMALASPAAIAIENAIMYSNLERVVESRTYSLKQAQERLKVSEERFRAIFDNMRSGVIVFQEGPMDSDFIIVDVNRAAQEIEGFYKEEVLGKSVHQVFPGFEELGVLEVFLDVCETGSYRRIPPCFYKDNLRSGWREYDVCKLPSGELVVIYDDVTEQICRQQEQEELQKRMLHAQKLESVGRLAGGVAHNFRNILQAILGNVEYLEIVEPENQHVCEAVENITASVEKGVELIHSLLHFSKLRSDFKMSTLDMAEVIQDTYKIIEKLFDKSINISMDLESGLLIKGNHGLLSQVFMNLFTNARDAMPEGGRLEVKAWREGWKVLVKVSDTGHGMDNKTLEKIFDPFFTDKEVGKGSGLGLATVHGIVEEHRGQISVESEPGIGTTFTLEFPYEKEKGTEEANDPEAVHLGNGEKIMVVDDEINILNVLKGMIQKLGYKVKAIESGTKAIEEYDTWHPDLVLMDRNMPEIDGVSCIKQILKRDPDARIVIVSGYEESGPHGIDGSVRERIKGYVTKPCNHRELSRVLAEVLGKIPGQGTSVVEQRYGSIHEG